MCRFATYFDPVAGLWVVEEVAPVGGWHFVTGGTGNLPQTIYGFYLTDTPNPPTVLYGSQLLDTPIPLSAAGQGFDIPPPRFNFSPNSPF